MSDAETLGWGDRWRAHLEVAAMETGEDLAAGRVIAAVLPRRTYLERPSPSGRSVGQPIAANIDVVLIVEPMDPTPSVGRVERFAAMSRSAGAEAWLVLTKTDLVAPGVVEEALTGMAPWVDAAVGVTSVDPASTERLRTLLPKGAPAVLVVRSGAGKSTLLNTILGVDHATGEGRSSDSKGRLDSERLGRYQRMLRESARLAARSDARHAHEQEHRASRNDSRGRRSVMRLKGR